MNGEHDPADEQPREQLPGRRSSTGVGPDVLSPDPEDVPEDLGEGIDPAGGREHDPDDQQGEVDDEHHAEVEEQRELQHRERPELADDDPGPTGARRGEPPVDGRAA